MKNRLAILLLLLICKTVLALPLEKRDRALEEALVQLLAEPPIPQAQPQPGVNPFQETADLLYRRYGKQEDDFALPGAKIPLTDLEREELYRELQNDPDYLGRLGVYLPRRREVLDWATSQCEDSSDMPDWLLAIDPLQRAELIQRASLGRNLPLQALAILDWPSAEPTVTKMLDGKTSDDVLTGLAALRRHAPRELEARTKLLAIARDQAAQDFDRVQAADLLLTYEWAGRDELFERMLREPFWQIESGYSEPIEKYAASHPEWAPRLVAMLEDPDRVAHNSAVIALNALVLRNPSAETIRPLLPWLTKGGWADASLSRTTLIEAAGLVDAPESVPGLLNVLRTSESEDEMLTAATSLVRYCPEGFESAWRAAKPRFLHSGYGENLAGLGVTQGWVSLDEQVEAVATLFQSSQRWSSDAAKPFPVLLGGACAYGDESSPELRARLAVLARGWQTSGDPALQGLEESLSRHDGPEVDAYFLSRLKDSDVTPKLLKEVFARRRALVTDQASALRTLLSDGGASAGVARAILRQGLPAKRELLDDAQALAWISACRYLGEKIPVDWLRNAAANQELREGVFAYLEASEDLESRLLLESLDPGFRIAGRKPITYDFAKLENALTRRYQERGGTGDLYALTTSHDGHTFQRASQEVWIQDGKAELIFRSRELGLLSAAKEHPSYDRRPLSRPELDRFLGFVENQSVDTWGEWLNVTSYHFTTYQYLHLSPGGGRRVAATFNAGTDQGEAGGRYAALIDLFEDMKAEPSETVYEFMEDIPATKVVEDHLMSDLLLEDAEGLKARLVDDEMNYTWRLLGANGLGAAATTIPVLPTERYTEGRTAVCLPNGDKLFDGYGRLMRDDGRKETTFIKGEVSLPVTEPSGQRGLLVVTTGEGETENRALKLVDLTSGKMHEVALAPADLTVALAYLPHRKKFLAARSEGRVESVNQAECYLIDPVTGESSRIEGSEFRPWLDTTTRPLQSAGGGRYWAALETGLGTEVGLVNDQSFGFEPVAHYPGVFFDSSQMWVSPPYIYAAIGDIVRLPLEP